MTLGLHSAPIFGGFLRHAVVGDLPPGWFASDPPPRPADFRLLRDIFAELPIDAAGRARLYSYLFATFHRDSITSPVPLLVLDSWTQSRGKSQCLDSLGWIIDGAPSAIRYDNVDDLVAHYYTGNRLAVLDNLDGAVDYNHTLISTILASRVAHARPKYLARTVPLAGRLAALNLVWGQATLHQDLTSRAWRVQFLGRGRMQFSRGAPADLARDNVELLRAQVYHTLLEAPAWELGYAEEERVGAMLVTGAAAYAHLFGLPQEEVDAVLRGSATDGEALSSAFLLEISKAHKLTLALPVRARYTGQTVVGLSGGGYAIERH